MSYPAGEPLTSKITKAVVTYLNDCIVGHREPWDEGGLYNAVEEAFASDSHNPPDARAREEALRVFYRMLDLDNAHMEDAARAAIASVAGSYAAENARLREALSELVAYCNHLGITNPVMRVAREALEAGER